MSRKDFVSFLATRLDPPDPKVFEKLDYVPTPRQQEFHDSKEFDVLFGGSVGGGKSRALVAEGIRACALYPGLRVGAFRRTYGELKESLLAELAAMDYAKPLNAKWNGTEYELRFPNGSVIMFRYAESMQDASRRLGGQYQLLLFDERTLTPPEVCTFLETRLRSGREDIPVLGIRSATNPGGPGHSDVKKRYIDATGGGARVITDHRARTVRFIQSKLSDNPHVNAEYADDLRGLPEHLRRAYLDGDWNQFAGQVFAEWRHDKHTVRPMTLPATWKRYAGIDWGYTAPWAVVWGAVDEDGRVWIYRELYATQVGEADQARRILDAEHGENVSARFADDAMWATRGDAKPIADVYAEHGAYLTRAGKGAGSRVNGWQRVHSYMADGPACAHHRKRGFKTCPMMHVFDTLENFIRTVPALPHARTGDPEDVDTSADDHCLIAGTMVRTDHGDIPIEQMTAGQRVWTRGGWQSVTAAGRTGVNRPVLSVTLSNGATIAGTAGHPVFTVERGFVPLDTLRYSDTLLVWHEDARATSRDRLKSLYSTASNTVDTQDQHDHRTPGTTPQCHSTGSRAWAGFTRRFTSSITAPSLRAITCITPIMITATTILRISFLSRLGSTLRTMGGHARRTLNSWRPFAPSPLNGTGPTRGEPGIGNMAYASGRTSKPGNVFASNVATVTRPAKCHYPGSVQTIARLNGGETPGLTTSSVAVQVAETYSPLTSTPGRKLVPVNVVSVSDAGRADVYNLTVDNYPEYLANGILVHNCADALRYMLVNIGSGPQFPILDHPETPLEMTIGQPLGQFAYIPRDDDIFYSAEGVNPWDSGISSAGTLWL